MQFNMDVWHEFREKVLRIGIQIFVLKTEQAKVNGLKDDYIERNNYLKIEVLEPYLKKITAILQECSDYMDKCDMPRPTKLWTYIADDPTTHASSVTFKYKDRLTDKQIKAYGKTFMSINHE